MKWIRSNWVRFLLGLVLLGSSAFAPASSALAEGSQPGIHAVLPGEIANDVDTPIMIVADNFAYTDASEVKIFLGNIELPQKGHLLDQDNIFSTVIPWGIKPGSYPIRLVAEDGVEAGLENAIQITHAIGQWSSQALDGGPIAAVIPVEKTPGLLYAYSSTTRAIYQSIDYAAHWTTVGHMGGQFFNVDQIEPNHMYLNFMHSADGGASWVDMLGGKGWPGADRWPGPFTQTFTDPEHSGTIFLAAADIPSGSGSPSGLLRSTDYGQTWTAAEQGLVGVDLNVTALAFSGDVSGTIYLGTRDGNLYRSKVTDGSLSWEPVSYANKLESIGILAVNPYDPNQLWVTTHFQTTPTAKVLKVDLSNGYSSTPVWPVYLSGSYPTTLGFVDANTVYIATRWDNGWITHDGGDYWDLLQPSNGKPGNSLALDPWDETQRTFYMADEQFGVQKTSNRGTLWNIANTGLHAMAPDILAVDPTNPAYIYSKIAQNGWPGIYVSQDGGQHWAFSTLMVPESTYRPLTSTLAVNARRVFVGAHSSDALGPGPNLYVSENHGLSWTRIQIDPTPAYPGYFYIPWALQVDPVQTDTLLMTTVIGNRSLTTDNFFSEIYRSTDDGDTWQRINLKDQLGKDVVNLRNLAFDPNDPRVVYAAGDHQILKSTDNGLTWQIIRESKSVDEWLGGPIAVEPVAPYRVYVGSLVSTDDGAHWAPANMPFGFTQMAFIPNSDVVYIAGDGLAVSSDGGTNWDVVGGKLAAATINALALAQVDSRYIVYIGTPGGAGAQASLAVAGVRVQSGGPLEAGVYRMTEVHTHLFLPMVKR